MLTFILNESFRDYVFYENEENILLLNEYLELLENNQVTPDLEHKIFEILDQHIYYNFEFYEAGNTTLGAKFRKAFKEETAKADYNKWSNNDPRQPGISGWVKDKLGIESFRQEGKNIINKAKTSSTNAVADTSYAKKIKSAAEAGLANIKKRRKDGKTVQAVASARLAVSDPSSKEAKTLRKQRVKGYNLSKSGKIREKIYKTTRNVLTKK